MRIENEVQLNFQDVMFRPKRSSLGSRNEVTLEKHYTCKHSGKLISGVPIIAANMDSTGTFAMARALKQHKCFTALHKHYSVDELTEFFAPPDERFIDTTINNQDYTFYSMGIVDADLEKFKTVYNNVNHNISLVCIDVANGYMQKFVDFCKRFRDMYPTLTIMAGNVVTGDIVEELIFNGVDLAKIGISGGSVCTTRKITGVGRPQLSAVIECADAAHGQGGLVCSDGGCTVPGDIAKAFGANSDFVMLGGMLAAHKESGGTITNTKRRMNPDTVISLLNDVVIFNKKHYKLGDLEQVLSGFDPEECLDDRFFIDMPTSKSTMKFYGMSSEEAMNKHAGGVAKHRASEGKCVELPYRGPVENTMQEILGGLRSTCTYVGSKSLKDLPKCTTFYRVNMQTNDVYGKS